MWRKNSFFFHCFFSDGDDDDDDVVVDDDDDNDTNIKWKIVCSIGEKFKGKEMSTIEEASVAKTKPH